MRIVRCSAVLLWVLAGCYSPSPQEGAPCQSSTQCPTPQRCVLGSCSLREAPEIDAAPEPPVDAAIDAPPPPIDAPRLACVTDGLTCGMQSKSFMCGGNCWTLCTENIQRETARGRCVAWTGVLGEINDAAEQACVHAELVATMGTWVGLFQVLPAALPRDGWTWNTTKPLVYTNWLSGKPDDGDGNENGLEQCASMRPDGFWDDNSCTQTLDFLCERP